MEVQSAEIVSGGVGADVAGYDGDDILVLPGGAGGSSRGLTGVMASLGAESALLNLSTLEPIALIQSWRCTWNWGGGR